MTNPYEKSILLMLVFPLLFSCNKDIDNDGDDIPNAITDGQWVIANEIDSLGQQTLLFSSAGSCLLS